MTKIGVIPDLHLMSENKEEVLEELESVKTRFEDFQPDIVILPGDIIQDENSEKDREHVGEVRNRLEELDCKIRFLGGNHDCVNLELSELETEFQNELWGMEEVDGENLIFLDTSLPKDVPQGKVTSEQLDFLERKLQEVEDAIIFIHHPLHHHDTQGTYWWHNRPERALCMNKKEVNDILSENPKVKAVFNGHVHYNKHVRYQGLDHLNLNAFNKEISGSKVTGTYAEITVDEQEIRTRVKEGEELIIGHTFPNKTQKEKLRHWKDIDRELRRIE
jgi:3',5'-cyclic AMP phosphodiesterase CpdA